MSVGLRTFAVLLLLSGSLESQDEAALVGAGATFPAPIYQRWIRSFETFRPGTPIRYEPIGSEEGMQKIAEGNADFAASDFPPSEAILKKLHVSMIATVLGGAVPAYNLPNLQRDLRFSPKLLADIYLGKVTRWDDPSIKALNHNAKLPGEKIVVVHRSDGSGTSYMWTDFLSKVSEEWRTKVGASTEPQWPTGRGANGNDGLASLVANTPYSIGYTELIYALRAHVSYGSIENSAGNFVQANIDTLTAAAATAQGSIEQGISIVNARGTDSYPVTSFTWILVPLNIESTSKRERLRAFLDWALSMGQREAAALGYIALPSGLAERERSRTAHFWR